MFVLLFGTTNYVLGQKQFDYQRLSSPTDYGPEIVQSIKVDEVETYEVDTGLGRIFIANGLNSSSYPDPSSWLSVKDSLIPKQVDVVFSKFPILDGSYNMKYPLLCNRLKRLFDIDSSLNSNHLQWRIVLQTNCPSEERVRELFHGIVIHYEVPTHFSEIATEEEQQNKSDTSSPFAKMSVTTSLATFSELPPEVKKELNGKTEVERREVLLDYYQSKIQESVDEVDTANLDTYLLESKTHIETFIKYNSFGRSDNTVLEVLNRNEWENALIVADWTGSMYRYGAHVLLWHSLHYKKSNIAYITLFNDGDHKLNYDKVVGSTGGIYHSQASKLKGTLDLYRYVMLQGGGGDIQENDLEAVIAGIKQFPDHGDVVLIADNGACVRDINLLDSIDVPIHIVLCGLGRRKQINPQYLHIAAATGGSIHTISSDIKNLTLGRNGKVIIPDSISDSVNVSKVPCNKFTNMYPAGYFEEKVFKSLKEARKNPKQIVNLSLSGLGYKRVPRRVKNYGRLKSVDLSYNNISRVNKAVFKLPYLEMLDLKGNRLKEVSPYFASLKILQRLDLSDNLIDSVPKSLLKCRSLKYLSLADNEIRTLPNNFYYKELEQLDLSNNHLRVLPTNFFRMRSLNTLNLSNNNIKEIPSQIGSMKKLRKLDLSDNKLEKLPKGLAKLKRLEYLNLTGNDLSYEAVDWLRSKLPNTTIEFQ